MLNPAASGNRGNIKMDNVITKAGDGNKVKSDASAANEMLNCVQDCLSQDNREGKVTGIGGVFLKSKGDGRALADWYDKNLGLHIDDRSGVAILNWSDDLAKESGVTAWRTFPKDTNNFEPSNSDFMINYRVDSIEKIHERLKANGVNILKGPESYDYGKFLWIMDPEGNKVELWEPNH